MPLHVEVGMTRGDWPPHRIRNEKWLPAQKVTTVLTHVEVDARDDAFKHPKQTHWAVVQILTTIVTAKIPFIHDTRKGFPESRGIPIPQK